MTSSLRVADVKGDIFGRTISPPSIIAVAFYTCEVMEGGGGVARNPKDKTKKPGLDRVNSDFGLAPEGPYCLYNIKCHCRSY